MKTSSKLSGWIWAIVIVGVGLFALSKYDGSEPQSKASDLPLSQPKPSIVIVSQDQKSMGTGDGSLYNYVTVRNTGSSLINYVGVDSTCTNDAGTVVGTGYGNQANVAPGEQAVVTVMLLDVDDCTHISSTFDSLTD